MRTYKAYNSDKVKILKSLLRKLIALVPLTNKTDVKIELRIALISLLKLLRLNTSYNLKEKFSLEDELMCLIYKQYGATHKEIIRKLPLSLKDIDAICRRYGYRPRRRGKYKKKPVQFDLFD